MGEGKLGRGRRRWGSGDGEGDRGGRWGDEGIEAEYGAGEGGGKQIRKGRGRLGEKEGDGRN